MKPNEVNLTVFIADDSSVVRLALTNLLSTIEGVAVIGEADNIAQAKKAIQESQPDLVIQDLTMPGGDGLDVVRHARQLRPAPIIVMLSMHRRSEMGERCLAEGADYYFQKASDLSKLLDLIQDLASLKRRAHMLKRSDGDGAGTQSGMER